MAYTKNVKYLTFGDPERSRSLSKILQYLYLKIQQRVRVNRSRPYNLNSLKKLKIC